MDVLNIKSQREDFIKQYGIHIDMPANYVFGAMFCRYNNEYIVIANKLSFPEKTEFYDFDQLEHSNAY